MNPATTLEYDAETGGRQFAASVRRLRSRRTRGRQAISNASVATGIVFLVMALGVVAWVLI